jgi:hypothetical protein
MTVENFGPCPDSADVIDQLTGPVEFVSGSPNCTTPVSPTTVVCELPSLADDQQQFVSITVEVTGPGVIFNSAEVRGENTSDPVEANNHAGAFTNASEPSPEPGETEDDQNPGGLNGFGTFDGGFDTFGTTGNGGRERDGRPAERASR